MKKWFCAFFAAVLLAAGGCCAKIEYCAVSISGGADGGVYCFQRSGKEFHTPLPRVNYLIYSPANGLYYATQNGTPGKGKNQNSGNIVILSKKINVPLKILQSVPVNGITPCHLTISPDGRFIYSANYSSGTISEFALKDGVIVSPGKIITHTGSGPNRRQRSAHPHFVGFAPAGNQLFVCDLGSDEVVVYDYTASGIRIPAQQKLKLPPGSGPRHLIFSPCGKFIYVANELNSTVTGFALRNGSWIRTRSLSTRCAGGKNNKNFPGAIKISRDGSWFLVTNRGDDNLALFRRSAEGDFKLARLIPAHGKYPSDILLDRCGKNLYIINLKSGNVVTFAISFPAGEPRFVLQREHSLPRGIGLCR